MTPTPFCTLTALAACYLSGLIPCCSLWCEWGCNVNQAQKLGAWSVQMRSSHITLEAEGSHGMVGSEHPHPLSQPLWVFCSLFSLWTGAGLLKEQGGVWGKALWKTVCYSFGPLVSWAGQFQRKICRIWRFWWLVAASMPVFFVTSPFSDNDIFSGRELWLSTRKNVHNHLLGTLACESEGWLGNLTGYIYGLKITYQIHLLSNR